jgi:hypothetical protein
MIAFAGALRLQAGQQRSNAEVTVQPRWDMASLPAVPAPPPHDPTRPQVFIEGLEIEALIGIYDWERRIRQPLRFDVEMAFDNRKPAPPTPSRTRSTTRR